MPDYPNLRMTADHGTSLTLRALRKEAKAALAELARLKRVYSVFIEASPPGDQKAFAEACFAAWEEKCELGQAWKYLLDDARPLYLARIDGKYRATTMLPYCEAFGRTPHEAIIRLCGGARFLSQQTAERKGA